MDKLKNYNRLVSDYFTLQNHSPEGEIGIEIEVEGQGLPKALGSYWTVHNDGSLRGEAAEYVLIKPTKRENVLPYLKYLQKKLSDSVVNDSPRTSVHVHFNQNQRTILQVYVTLTVYFILEELLIPIAGVNRVGNLFCLRLKDAEYLLDALEKSVKQDDYFGLADENRLRYSAVNVTALSKFNSLEFRALRGTTDPDTIHEWILLLSKILDNSDRYYKTPLDVIQDFSALGSQRFLEKILEDFSLKFPKHSVDRLLWSGARLIQSLAYCTDWVYSDYKPVKRMFSGGQKLPVLLVEDHPEDDVRLTEPEYREEERNTERERFEQRLVLNNPFRGVAAAPAPRGPRNLGNDIWMDMAMPNWGMNPQGQIIRIGDNRG